MAARLLSGTPDFLQTHENNLIYSMACWVKRAYLLPHGMGAVKGLFVAVPQIDRNLATHARSTLKPRKLWRD
jgi:hypothetical protein